MNFADGAPHAQPSAARGERDSPVVVILNWNAEGDTAACIESFLAQQGTAGRILLVDNDSADGSGDRLRARFPMVDYLQTGANLGYAGGNNRGIAWALAQGADWILVVNNDTVADPQCLRRLLDAALSEPRLAAVAPLIVRYDEPDRVWFAGGRFDRVRAIGVHFGEGRLVHGQVAEGAPVRPCSFLTGCCLLLRRTALEQVGGFAEDYFAYGEDVELCLRLQRAGWRLGWTPLARLAHRVPARQALPRPDQIRLRDRNRRRLVRAHYGWLARLSFALWFWPTRLIHLGRYVARRDRPRAAAIVAGMRER